MSVLTPGTMEKLTVDREVEFGYFLVKDNESVLLHHNEMTAPIEIGQELDVFLYQDKQGRLAATMSIPKIQLGEYGWCEVVDVVDTLGAFIDIGISKDILIHEDDLPKFRRVWPEKGGKLYCTLKLDNNGRLLGKIATENIMSELFIKADRNIFNKNITGTVYRTLWSGTFIITSEGYRGFVHESQRKEEPRIGEQVEGRVIDVKEDGSVNVSLLKRSHEVLNDDAEKIYSYLLERGGTMPYTDKSMPEEIEKRFQMSKGAFKRGLGRLMKENKITQKDGWTTIKNE